jgi:TRAP-type transport system periplasmic protein
MEFKIDRRTVLKAGAALAASQVVPAWAQGTPTLRFAAVFSDKDIRADMIRMLSKDVEANVKIEPFYGGTLFKQGTELVALQRDNLELGNIAPQDISKQLPAWSVLTSAYTFRDAHHVLAFFASDLGAKTKKQAEDQLKIKILGPTFYGTRQVGLKPKKKINTPADMAGIKLRMPPGDAWQLLGRSIGANPTPMAYAETYTGLQTGAIDGQDNPLPNVQNMKFYEVMSQIVLTSHLVAFDVLCMNQKSWNAMDAAKQKSFQAAVDKALSWSAGEHLKREAELADTFKKQGLDVYVPDIPAFRTYAQKVYLASDEAKSWEPGILDKIGALKS